MIELIQDFKFGGNTWGQLTRIKLKIADFKELFGSEADYGGQKYLPHCQKM